MAPDPTRIVVAANGSIAVGPVGTAAPTDVATSLNVAMVDVGTVTEDGATLAFNITTEEFGGWHTLQPVLSLPTGVEITLATAFREFQAVAIQAAMGGDVSDNAAPGEWIYDPPAPDDVREVALAVEWSYSDDDFRLWIPRAIPAGSVEWNLVNAAPLDLPVTYQVLDPGSGAKPFRLFTDAASFDIAS